MELINSSRNVSFCSIYCTALHVKFIKINIFTHYTFLQQNFFEFLIRQLTTSNRSASAQLTYLFLILIIHLKLIKLCVVTYKLFKIPITCWHKNYDRHFTEKGKFCAVTQDIIVAADVLMLMAPGHQQSQECHTPPIKTLETREHKCRLSLVQIMACCLFGAKPLSKSTLGYHQLDPSEQTSVKF